MPAVCEFAAEYQTVYCTIEDARATVAARGVAVVRSVLSTAEVEDARRGMWDCLETLTAKMGPDSIDRTRPEEVDVRPLLPIHSMLLQHYGIGHSQFVWDVRGSAGVRAAFARVWGTDDLITSFDGVSIHVPHEYTGRGFYRGNDWWHTDQASTRPGLESLQGLVNLWDVRPGDATLRVLTSSNAHHRAFFEAFGIEAKSDWFKLGESAHLEFFEQKGCRKLSVLAAAGDLVLWDSRTMHCGGESHRGRAEPQMRCAVYVCMVPRCKATVAVQRRRRAIFEALRMTGHSPHHPKMFGKLPRLYPGAKAPEVTPLPAPVLTTRMRQLV